MHNVNVDVKIQGDLTFTGKLYGNVPLPDVKVQGADNPISVSSTEFYNIVNSQLNNPKPEKPTSQVYSIQFNAGTSNITTMGGITTYPTPEGRYLIIYGTGAGGSPSVPVNFHLYIPDGGFPAFISYNIGDDVFPPAPKQTQFNLIIPQTSTTLGAIPSFAPVGSGFYARLKVLPQSTFTIDTSLPVTITENSILLNISNGIQTKVNSTITVSDITKTSVTVNVFYDKLPTHSIDYTGNIMELSINQLSFSNISYSLNYTAIKIVV